jgi:hypothetical protein
MGTKPTEYAKPIAAEFRRQASTWSFLTNFPETPDSVGFGCVIPAGCVIPDFQADLNVGGSGFFCIQGTRVDSVQSPVALRDRFL